mmetsp:Transcript_36313/g.116990  ORF Transcript_36313/g.116990 Transcript_36313/m.116990 type:complete len:274 (-) Transcript_36313:259-1080(-)
MSHAHGRHVGRRSAPRTARPRGHDDGRLDAPPHRAVRVLLSYQRPAPSLHGRRQGPLPAGVVVQLLQCHPDRRPDVRVCLQLPKLLHPARRRPRRRSMECRLAGRRRGGGYRTTPLAGLLPLPRRLPQGARLLLCASVPSSLPWTVGVAVYCARRVASRVPAGLHHRVWSRDGPLQALEGHAAGVVGRRHGFESPDALPTRGGRVPLAASHPRRHGGPPLAPQASGAQVFGSHAVVRLLCRAPAAEGPPSPPSTIVRHRGAAASRRWCLPEAR